MSKLEQFVQRFPWVRAEQIPFARLRRPLSECNVAVVSTGGLYDPADAPFAIATASDVDESYRRIPVAVPPATLGIAHQHFNQTAAVEDINVIFPVQRLQELAAAGVIGAVADTNYSISGYIPQPEQLFRTGQAIAAAMQADRVDAALIVPV